MHHAAAVGVEEHDFFLRGDGGGFEVQVSGFGFQVSGFKSDEGAESLAPET
jgi:hypothetical protein